MLKRGEGAGIAGKIGAHTMFTKKQKERWTLALQAIIMAGGEGSRLRPLTVHTPKPLVPLLGKPVMGYAIDLLKRHGVKDIGVTLWYQPQKIRRAFGRGEKQGVQLKYYEEIEPLGTAGSVKMARKQLKDTFLVLSGDGLTDCDLTAALRFHREKKALATLVLKRVNVPLLYGVVLTDGNGRITRFIEKPGWSRVYSDLVNTGVYILEPDIFDRIPDQGMPDFGKDIFPGLAAGGLPVFGYETDGYWCDVGGQRAYLAAQMDLLAGRVALPHPEGVHETAQVNAAAQLEGLYYIGPGTAIGPGAVIRDAVIGENCRIGAGAVVERSCLWPEAQAGEKARIWGSVLCQGAIVRRGAEISDGCALGNRAVAGAYATLHPGVKVWPHLKVASGAAAIRSVLEGDCAVPQWTARGAECDTVENVSALCTAFVRVTGVRRVIAAGDGNQAMESLTVGALSAAGARVLSAGEMTEPMLKTLIRALDMEGGVFSAGHCLQFYTKEGGMISAKQRAAMEGCLLRQEGTGAFSQAGPVIPLTGAEEIYLSRIIPAQSGPLFSPVALFCDALLVRRLAQEGLQRMGARDFRVGKAGEAELRPEETGFLVSEDGEDFALLLPEKTAAQEQKTMLLLALCKEKNGVIYDFPGIPRAAEEMAALRPPEENEGHSFQRLILEDGLAAVLFLCEALKKGPLEAMLDKLPETHIVTEEIPCKAREKGRILHTLCDQTALPHSLGEGIRIRHQGGYATVVPDAYRDFVRVTGEARSGEFARELCGFYQNQIKNITNQR